MKKSFHTFSPIRLHAQFHSANFNHQSVRLGTPLRYIFYAFLRAVGKFNEYIPEFPLVLNQMKLERSPIEITKL